MSKHKSRPVSIQTVKPPAVDTSEMFCRTCCHYDRDEMLGICRRSPPTVFLTPSGHAISHWPPVKANDGCGEWSANG